MRRVMRVMLLTTALMSCASLVRAQSIANTLRELQLLVRNGETITVADTQGRECKGRIEVLSPSSLVVRDGSGRHEWTEADIASIRHRRADSLGNGALIGLAAGSGFGLIASITASDGEDEAGWILLATGFYGGLGAGIGVGIDALVRHELVIFQRPAPRMQVRLQPLLTPRRQGLLVSVGY